MATKDYSLDALNRFLDYAANKGLLKRNTAVSRKQAANKILSILEPQENNDLREVDVQHAFDRFVNLQGTEFKPESLQVYQSRLKSALGDFFAYVENPAAFKPTGVQRTTNPNGKGSAAKEERKRPNNRQPQEPREPQASHEEKQLVIPVPLRAGLTVRIHNVPPDLTNQEAEKLAAIVRAYAMPED